MQTIEKWCRCAESNRRPTDYESCQQSINVSSLHDFNLRVQARNVKELGRNSGRFYEKANSFVATHPKQSKPLDSADVSLCEASR